MTTEEMRLAWRQPLPPESSEFNRRSLTALDKLKRRYHRFIVMELIFIIMGIAEFSGSLFPAEWRLLLIGGFTLYLVICALIDLYLYSLLSRIDVWLMSPEEVAARALKARKHHLLSIFLLMPLAIGFCILLLCALNAEKWALTGLAVGFVIGLSIGSVQLRRFLSDYKIIVG